MPQSPFKVDQLQIEPGSGQSLLIKRASDGSLQFFDALNTQGVKLSDLSGLQSIASVSIVGTSNAEYTSIQDAIDDIPSGTTTARNPALILVLSGVYSENLTIDKDGVCILGLGSVVIESASESTPDVSAADTITITATNPADPPKQVVLKNLTISNAHQAKSCVRAIGIAGSQVGLIDTSLSGGKPAVTYGLGGIWIQDCRLLSKGTGSFPLRAESVNSVYLLNSSCAYSVPTSQIRILECAEFVARSVDNIAQIRLDYDTTAGRPTPSLATSSYTLQDCEVSEASSITLRGLGSTQVMGGSFGNTLVVSGNMQTSIEHSALSDLTVNDTATVLLKSTSRGTLAGSGSVSEAVRSGVLTFAAQSSQSIVFGSRKVSDQYSVHVELPQAPSGNAYACIENKSDTGFTVAFRNSAQTLQAQTFILRWIAVEYP